LALNVFPDNETQEWERRSLIGQTYGAASAILSVLAIGGIAVSLFLQNRETKAAREQALRALHVDLIKTALDDPQLLSCWGPFSGSVKVADRRKHMYTNLMVSHWQMMWEVNGLNEKHLRVLAQELFAGENGRQFWSLMGAIRTDVEGGRRTKLFHTIVNEEYERARLAGPPVQSQEPLDSADTAAVPVSGHRTVTVAAALGVGAVLGACAAVVLRRRRHMVVARIRSRRPRTSERSL
jgi:hypothetical protein